MLTSSVMADCVRDCSGTVVMRTKASRLAWTGEHELPDRRTVKRRAAAWCNEPSEDVV